MNFEELKQYYEDFGWNVRIYDTASSRILKASRLFIEVEYEEDEWMNLSEEEQLEDLEEIKNEFKD